MAAPHSEVDRLRRRIAELELELARSNELERRLRESEARYRTLFETTQDGIAIVDDDGNFAEVNESLCLMLRGSRERLAGAHFSEFIPAEEFESASEKFAALRDGTLSRIQVPLRALDGTIVELEWVAAGSHLPGLHFCTCRDVTERNCAERAVEASEARYRALLEATSQLVWTADASGDYGQSLYPWWTEITGQTYEPGDVSGWLQSLHPDDCDRVKDEWSRAVKAQNGFETEYRVMSRNGEYRHFCVRAVPIRNADGSFREWVGAMTDVTEHVRVEEQLRQAQKLESVGALAGGIAHDFNNLLTGIVGNISLAGDFLDHGHPAHRVLSYAQDACQKAAMLTSQLLAYAGKGRFVIGRIQFEQMARGAVEMLRSSLAPNVTLEVAALSRDEIEGDATQLQQVIMNLVINAAEAIPLEQAGTVTIAASSRVFAEGEIAQQFGEDLPAGRYLFLEVGDNGSGMTDDVKARIFDPFFSTKFTGRGLGLAAVLGIVRGHRGAMKVDSEVGRGTTFRIVLPALPPRPEAEKPAVLVIDDEEQVRRMARMTLEHHGYAVLEAANGLEGVEMFARHRHSVSAVLLDLTMPVMNGVAALERIHAIDPDVRVILSSGYNETTARQRFADREISIFLQKPYTAGALADKLKQLLTITPL